MRTVERPVGDEESVAGHLALGDRVDGYAGPRDEPGDPRNVGRRVRHDQLHERGPGIYGRLRPPHPFDKEQAQPLPLTPAREAGEVGDASARK